MIILIAIAASVATLMGGLIALRLKDRLHIILGFSAGAVIAVAFFDLMPEAIELGGRYLDSATMFSVVAIGFLGYLLLDRIISLHAHSDGHEDGEDPRIRRSALGAGSLSIHSFLDGVAIGLAFQVSEFIGLVVAIAVLVHDFSDGVNTVNLVLKDKGVGIKAFRWLVVDALAPVAGAASTLLFSLPEQALAIILALFSGFFLYIGASDLIPESHHGHPKFLTTAMTLLGAGILYLAIHAANI